jgi:hypothetical protein
MPENVTSDFTEMDNAGISDHHWKIMLSREWVSSLMPMISSSSAS